MAAFFAGPDASGHDEALWASVFQVVSHVVFLACIIDFLPKRKYYATAIALSVLVSSGSYHMCRATWYCFGLGDVGDFVGNPDVAVANWTALDKWRFADHVASGHAFAAVVLSASMTDSGGGPHVNVYRLFLFSFCVFAELLAPFSLQANVVMLSMAALIIAYEYLVVRQGRLPQPDRFHSKLLIAAGVLAILGVGLYLLSGNSLIPYDYGHPPWHICIGVVLYLTVNGVHWDHHQQQQPTLSSHVPL